MLKIRNIPANQLVIRTESVKPVFPLTFLILLGAIMMLLNTYFSYFGFLVTGLALFGIVFMPDRRLFDVTEEYLILYNCKEKDACNLVYYEDIVTWRYQRSADTDEVIFNLVDGSMQSIEAFRKSSIAPYLNYYAKDKEAVATKTRKVKR